MPQDRSNGVERNAAHKHSSGNRMAEQLETDRTVPIHVSRFKRTLHQAAEIVPSTQWSYRSHMTYEDLRRGARWAAPTDVVDQRRGHILEEATPGAVGSSTAKEESVCSRQRMFSNRSERMSETRNPYRAPSINMA